MGLLGHFDAKVQRKLTPGQQVFRIQDDIDITSDFVRCYFIWPQLKRDHGPGKLMNLPTHKNVYHRPHQNMSYLIESHEPCSLESLFVRVHEGDYQFVLKDDDCPKESLKIVHHIRTIRKCPVGVLQISRLFLLEPRDP